MTWSISVSAASKEAAKRTVTIELPKAMLHQKPHAKDFDLVRGAINGAIDACAEGSISVSGSGHLNGSGDGNGDISEVRGVNIQLTVVSTPTA